jgi:hypothetical protein
MGHLLGFEVNWGLLVGLRARCLIHSAHLEKILSVCKILNLKIVYLEETLD